MNLRQLAAGCGIVWAAAGFLFAPAGAAEEVSLAQQRLLAAESAMEQGHSEDAVRIYSSILANDPGNAELLAKRGEAYYEIGRMDMAEADLRGALESAPDVMHPNYYMGLVKIRQGELSIAKEYLDRALALSKDSLERSAVQEALGQAALYGQDYERAIECFTESINGKESYPAYSHRASARMKTGDYAGAEEDLTRLTELYPNAPEPYHQRGICRGSSGKYHAALEDFTKAIGMDPENPSLYSDRGYTYACKGDLEAAVEDYTKALELDPKYSFAYSNRAAAYEKLGKKDLAKQDRELLEMLMEFEESGEQSKGR